ncbi:assimilatory sulfite reductase (NADPH) flavoprotein subunit [Vibrio cholerae]|uniref:assimilatory sulfite reductase (NADPH) flavoprotein subunit n=1 Tax=Vibrio paracholerae TaxID=650003 RepID=UPI0015EF8906|nr:assimilatory sulfite reductase (NADPH) flavoprotein subunit [Vibrio paracholerae]ELJ8549515.1 assimilatory sulfite reductase (NADPH) flavoprotein subunit [Vibrio cholerae]ELY5189396.1 assimilatory sulfite reductase (NADPH) flavoprotein subunit [Vibrio cholerae]ELY5289289.1 assimilatory sulfite reductase (NADPH) flavoprotein subunit [Vibrio cholerae]
MSTGNTLPPALAALASPLNDAQLNQLQQTVTQLNAQQLAWVSGYFWGLSQSNALSVPQISAGQTASAASGKLTIIFASQTGNAKGVAQALLKEAQAAGIQAQLFDASDYKGKDLAKETHVIFVASTNGEGEAPDNALALHEFLKSKKAPKLPNLKYGVLGLGDSSYQFFCQTGKDFDQFLENLGAQRLVERLDADVDYQAAATEWRTQVLSILKDELTGAAAVTSVATFAVSQTAESHYSKEQPYTASLSTSQKITGRDSGKDVRHIEIDLTDSGITYQPGDALGVWYENRPQLVNALLDSVGLSGHEEVQVDGETLSLHLALTHHYEITAANPQLVAQFAELAQSQKLTSLAQDKEALREYATRTQVIDVLREEKVTLSATQLLSLLRRLTPRLYSIASSQSEVGEEVHLTVGVVEYEYEGEQRLGGASSFLAHQLEEGAPVKVFVEHNNNFKLPSDDNAPLIMVGPGTGIAPFRSFIQERENRGAAGKNWLLFGDRTFTQDFLYQVEWQKYLKSGLLNRLDVAFSRDQHEKVYVQHRLLEQAELVWQWLQEGAYFYVCGDASRMAKDVHQALITVVEQRGGLNREQAEEYVSELRKAKRYQRDVY